MYVILTSKPGIFHVECEDARALESYDYLFCGKLKARFTIARIEQDVKMHVIEDDPPYIVNHVSTKFLDHFPSIEQARSELHHLAGLGSQHARLDPPLPAR